MSALVISSSAANGSSMSRIGLPNANARTSATRCCMPPESSCGRASQEVAEADLAEQVDVVGASGVGLARRLTSSSRRALASTVRHGSSAGVCGTKPIIFVARARLGVVSPTVIDPGARRLEPGHHPQQRRLAAPARPEQRDDLLRFDLEVGRRERVEIAERLGDVFEPDDGGHAAPETRLEQALDVFRQHVHLDVDRRAGRLVAERRDGRGVGDHRDAERVVDEIEGGEADAVDRDRSLLDQVAVEVDRDADAQVGRRIDDLADGVDVAEHEMSAEAIAERHRSLEVDDVSRHEATDHRAGQRLAADVGRPPPVADLDDGEAAAVDRDRGADRGIVEHGRGRDHEARRRVRRRPRSGKPRGRCPTPPRCP